ncbi:MAG: Clp protease N-terminal domain-containing protein [Pseudomonadota bacterium]
MANTFAERLGWIPKSESLRVTLVRALTYAQERNHVEVTLEHLLMALIDDPNAASILEACKVNLASLRSEAANYISSELTDLIALGEGEVQASESLNKVMAHASAAAEQSQRDQIDGAIVLAALIGEGESQAAHILNAFGLTFDVAVTNLKNYNPEQDNNTDDQNIHPEGLEAFSNEFKSQSQEDESRYDLYSAHSIDSQTEEVITNFTQSKTLEKDSEKRAVENTVQNQNSAKIDDTPQIDFPTFIKPSTNEHHQSNNKSDVSFQNHNLDQAAASISETKQTEERAETENVLHLKYPEQTAQEVPAASNQSFATYEEAAEKAAKDSSVQEILASVREIIGYDDQDDNTQMKETPPSSTNRDFKTSRNPNISISGSHVQDDNFDRSNETYNDRTRRPDFSNTDRKFAAQPQTVSHIHKQQNESEYASLPGYNSGQSAPHSNSKRASVKDYMLTRTDQALDEITDYNTKSDISHLPKSQNTSNALPIIPEHERIKIIPPPLPDEDSDQQVIPDKKVAFARQPKSLRNAQTKTSPLEKILNSETQEQELERVSDQEHHNLGQSSANRAAHAQHHKLSQQKNKSENTAPAQHIKKRDEERLRTRVKKETIARSYLKNIPKIMKVADEETVDITITREEIEKIERELIGNIPIPPHDILVTQSMTLRLSTPEGGIVIQPRTPPTQRTHEQNSDQDHNKDIFIWSWTLTPVLKGKHPLHLSLSSRIVGERGLFPNDTLPEQVSHVKVKRRTSDFLKIIGTIIFSLTLGLGAGFAIAKFGILF